MILMSVSGILIEIWGGHYIPLFNWFYIDNLAPFFHLGSIVHTTELDASRAAGICAGLRDACVVIHIIGAFCFIGLLTVHIGHIIRHQKHLKSNLLQRMISKD